ncbi:MAG: RNA pseudouridine synthase [Clostridia bacterium]|nr:RNA pseudouridine synthase [Clostridia bacterium]
MGKIVFEDSEVIVYFKEVGENSEKLGESLNGALVIHRLDLPVSGLLVLAKNKKSADKLSRDIAESRFEKIYTAEVGGKIEQGEVYKDILYHDKRNNKTFPVKSLRKGAKEAELEFEVLEKRQESTVVKIRLKTGRTHQIRVQFASRRHPLLGDGKYGSKVNGKIRLCASEVSFFHPLTCAKMYFSCVPWFLEKNE